MQKFYVNTYLQMNIRATIVILSFCSLAWISNSELSLGNLSIILAFTIMLTIKRVRKFPRHKYLIFITLIIIYFLVSFKNSFINEERRNIIIDMVYLNITEIKDKAKSKYYEEITDNIRGRKTSLPNEALGMSIEIDRSTSKDDLISAAFINYYLHFIAKPYFPTCISLGDNLLSQVLYVITVLFITSFLLIEINSKTNFKAFLWLLSLSLSVLAIIGIQLKYLYLQESINLDSVFFQLWKAPEQRISFQFLI